MNASRRPSTGCDRARVAELNAELLEAQARVRVWCTARLSSCQLFLSSRKSACFALFGSS